MQEQELIDLAIKERINHLLVEFDKRTPKSKKHHDTIIQAEQIIDKLSNDDRETVQYYIESVMERMAQEEPYLYKQGYIDAFRSLKKLTGLIISS